jgi:hypothetical protein
MSALALVFALVAAPVFAQGGSSSATLSGVVVDKDGGLIPGATVTVINVATGEKLPIAISNDKGGYSFPGLSIGTYKVTVTLSGFKTSETEVRLVGGSSNNITSTLEIGRVEEVVNVRAGSELVRTETPAVSQTVTADFMNTLPRNSRSALAFLAFLPGVSTTGSANNLRFGSNVTGLGSNTINITIDGVSNNAMNNNQGFFTLVTPRLDAVEEVTLTNSSAGADATGQGAVQVRFVTRSGTNKFDTSGYLYYQHAALNSNAYFTRLAGNPKAQNTNYTYGGRLGGPIVLPGFDGRGKAFFFFNWEEVYNPNQVQRTGRTFLRQTAQNGNFTYGAVGAQTTVNVFDLAKTFGQVSTPDADITRILNNIRSGAESLGNITELVTSPNTATHSWLVTNKSTNHAPTMNLTFNLTPKHRLQGSYYYQKFFLGPDTLNTAEPVFPGLTPFGIQDSFRTSASISLRSTLSTAAVNEARVGWQYSPVNFFLNIQPSEFDWQGGFAFGGQTFLTGNQPGLGFGLTNPTSTFANTPSTGKTPVYVVSDQFNYLKGSHSFTFGGDWTHVLGDNLDTQAVPAMNLGFNQTLDPAETAGMFNAANFPGASTADRNNARALYALLTGRVTSIVATANLNNAGDAYVYNGSLYTAETQEEYSAYAQDTWRLKPTVTITAGLRYQLQMPIQAKNGVFSSISAVSACGAASGLANGAAGTSTTSTDYLCNIFNPSATDVSPGVVPEYVQYDASQKGYDTDFNNLAPNIGLSWRPNKQNGFLRTLLGDPELATINGGYSRSYSRERLSNFLTAYSGRPGQNINVTRSTSLADFPIVPAGESWPLLFREKNRLTAPTFDPTPQFPASAFNQTASLFDPAIEVPLTDSWNVSFQRSLTKDTVVEIRYQGNNGSRGAWNFVNLNQVNIYDAIAPGGVTNGGAWLTGRQGVGLPGGEFEKAMGNLHANVVAGKGPTFAYTGVAGTQPLPILLAHLAKSKDVNNPAAYVGAIWTNSTFTGYLDPYFPDPSQFASNLYSSSAAAANLGPGVATRYFNNAIALGYPRNFWVANPDVSNLNVGMNSDNLPMNHQVILQVRRRLAAGLAVQAGYTWSRYFSGLQGISSNVRNFGDLHSGRINLRSTGVPHAIQSLWTYDIPFGRGKRYGANINPWLDGIAGGWTFSGTVRFQTQSFVLRGVELSPGWSLKQAQKDLSVLRFVTDPITGAQTVWNFPEEIYTNTRKAFSTDETQATYYAPGTEPTGKYFLPAGGLQADGSFCTYLYPGDCGNQEMWFLGRWFGEMDFALAKQFQLPGRARFEMRAEVFNATKALNFPNTINPSTSTNAFRITSTQSGARTAQIVWRLNW